MRSIHYRTSDYQSEHCIMEGITEVVSTSDFEHVDEAVKSAKQAIASHDEDSVCSLSADEVGPSGRKLMRFYEDAMCDYTHNIDRQLKEKIDDPFCTALDNFVNNVSNVNINTIVVKHGAASKSGTYGADGKVTISDTKSYQSDDVFNLEELLESEPHIQKVINQSYENAIKQDEYKDLKREDFQDMMTKGASFEYESYAEETARLKAEEEARLERERQERIEMAVDIGAMVGIGVLTFFVPPLGAGAAVAYTSYSATNVIAGKNMITGRKYSKSERIIEGIGLIPIGKVFKGVGKPALNMMSKTAGKTTAGQLMKSGLKNTTNMTTNRLIKLKTSYKVMMDKADVGYRVASAIERLEGKKEAIEMAGRSWYRGQKERLVKYVDEKMVPRVQSVAYKGADHYNKVNEALSKLGMAPKYAYAGIGTETAKKITKQDIDQYIQKASAKLTNKGTSSAVKSGTEGTINLTKNKGKSLKVDDKDAHLITRVDYKKKEHIVRGWRRRKELKPNVEFITPEGYLYRTDEFGRIKHVEATELILKKAKRKTYMQRVVGREFRKKDDDGGHLIASQFGGSGDLDNLVPMNSTLNRHGEWRKLEEAWAKALKAEPPKKVSIEIIPKYDNHSLRPKGFNVLYEIDGVFDSKYIVNEAK